MNLKIIIGIMLIFGLLPMILAAEPAFTFKQGEASNITLKVLNSDNSAATAAVSCYLTVKDPRLNVIINYQQMGFLDNGEFTYQIDKSLLQNIGQYPSTLDCEGATDYLSSSFYFEVTPSGFANTLGFYIIMLVVVGALILLGFSIKDGWFVVFGGIGLIGLGLYSINFGIAGFRDMFMTWTIGLFEIGVGAYLAIRSALEMMN